MNDYDKILAAFENAYGPMDNFYSPKEYMRLFNAFAEGWKAKPVNKIGRPKGKAAPKSKKAKES